MLCVPVEQPCYNTLMRLFIATTFDDEVTDRYVKLQKQLKNAGASGRFTPVENLHLTLAFIGEYGDPDKVMDVIDESALRPVELRVEGLSYYRDMYLLRYEQNPGLTAYVKRLRRALAEAGIPFDKKNFMPHITLARGVNFANGKPGNLPDITPDFDVTIDSVSLMKSERGKNGMIYTELGYFKG